MEMRRAKNEDLKWLKEIWKLSFGDEDSYIDQHFQSRDWINETVVLLQDDKIVSMQTLIPVDLIGEDDVKWRAAMLFAVATHPDFQKRGYADQLIEFSNQILLHEGRTVTVLVPATEALFHFYKKRSYQNGFTTREAVLSHGDIHRLPVQGTAPCTITPVEVTEYNRLRRAQLKGKPYLDYREKEISYQKKLSRTFGADLYSLETDGAEGCAYAERISPEQVIIKELLIPEAGLIAALRKISELLPAEKYIVRTPSCRGVLLGGTSRPFGMLRMNGSDNGSVNMADGYLGIAFD